MLTWQAHDGHGLEGVRVHYGAGKSFRALGRIVRAEPSGDFTASYRLIVAEDGSVERASFTSATAGRERHLTVNRTEDGYWLLDTGSGGTRNDFSGAIDVDLAGSVIFNALPVRRLDLLKEGGEHTLPVLYVTSPELEVSVVRQTYRVLTTGEQPVVEFRSEDFTAELSLDRDGFVIDYPGLAGRFADAPAVG
ncbi:MAG TPA: putative glycolipid-binding domain-containing protein [Pseudonocardia sp.]